MAPTEEQKRTRAQTRQRNDALRAEQDALRHEAKRREWREQDMHLTRDQAAAGEPCRGCGLPLIDALGSWPPLMYLSDQERIDHDAAESKYKELHRDCRAHRWSMEGSRTTHCGLCLGGRVRRDQELDIWALDLNRAWSREELVAALDGLPGALNK